MAMDTTVSHAGIIIITASNRVYTPNSAHKDTSVSMLCWHTVEADGPIVR